MTFSKWEKFNFFDIFKTRNFSSKGDPYPANIQRLVRGRENITERDGLVPIGPEPSFQAPHQHQELIPEVMCYKFL